MAGPKRWQRDQQSLSPRQWVSRLATRTGALTTLFLACLYAIGAGVRSTIDDDTQVAESNQSVLGPLLGFIILGCVAVVISLLIAHLLLAIPAMRSRPTSLPLTFAYVEAVFVGVIALIGFAVGPGVVLSVPASVVFGGGTFAIARGVGRRLPPYPQGLSIRRTDAGERPLGYD